MLNDPMISKSIYYTLLIALLAAVISTVIGTLAAIGIHVMKKKTKTVVLNVTYLPVLNPDIVTGIAFMLFFVAIGLKLGFTSMLIAHITFKHSLCDIEYFAKVKFPETNTHMRLRWIWARIRCRQSGRLLFRRLCPTLSQDFYWLLLCLWMIL